jgi:tetratricopeptide (TPR) repeat protein
MFGAKHQTMRSVIAVLILLFLYAPGYAQQTNPSNSDVDAVLKRTQRQLDSMYNSPKMKNMMKQAKGVNVDSLEQVGRKAQRSGGAGMPGMPGMSQMPGMGGMAGMGAGRRKSDTANYKIPKRDAAGLAGLPQKPLSTEALKNYLVTIDKRLTPKMRAAFGTTIVNTDNFSPVAISNAAIMASQSGQLDQAILLSIKAAERDPEDPLVLNTAGSLLQQGGLEIAAITVLESALVEDPGNSTVENNLGQSYLNLGDRENGRKYLQQCTASSPNHPMANSSLAMIDIEQGNKSAALNHVENSLRGAFSDKAYRLLYKLKQDPVLMDYFKERYTQPEYFDENKYPLPPQCEKLDDIPVSQGEYRAYKDMLDQVRAKFDKEQKEESKLGIDEMEQQVKNPRPGARRSQFEPPFMELATAMLFDRSRRYEKDDIPEFVKAQNEYKTHSGVLFHEYSEREKHSQSCGESMGLANEYMGKLAVEVRAMQKVHMRIYKNMFLDMAYWGFFATPNEHLRRAAFCQLVSGFLDELKILAFTTWLFVEPHCEVSDEQKETAEPIEIEAECPVYKQWEIPFGVGKFNIDCEKSEFQFGELIVLNISHNFNTGETMVALGPGVAPPIIGPGHHAMIKVPEFKKGPFQFGAEAGIKGQVFFVLDHGAVVDGGVRFLAELDILGDPREYTAGWTLGVNSGFRMEPGIVKDIIDQLAGPEKEAPQLNKNVKKYKP